MFRSSFTLCSRAMCFYQKPQMRLQNIFFNSVPSVSISHLKYSTNIDKTKQNDNKTSELIYYGTLAPQIRAVKIFSVASSMMGLIAAPMLYEKATEVGGAPMVVAVCSVVGFFTFITPLMLHWITRNYVIEIDYDPTTKIYTATTLSFFLRKVKHNFTPADVYVPDILGMFTSFKIKGKPVFVDMKLFKDPEHYIKIMSYDKPMDFKMGDSVEERKDSKEKAQ